MSNSIQYLKMNSLLDDYYYALQMDRQQAFQHEFVKTQDADTVEHTAAGKMIDKTIDHSAASSGPVASNVDMSNVHVLHRSSRVAEPYLNQVDEWIVKVMPNLHAEAQQPAYAPEATQVLMFLTQKLMQAA